MNRNLNRQEFGATSSYASAAKAAERQWAREGDHTPEKEADPTHSMGVVFGPPPAPGGKGRK